MIPLSKVLMKKVQPKAGTVPSEDHKERRAFFRLRLSRADSTELEFCNRALVHYSYRFHSGRGECRGHCHGGALILWIAVKLFVEGAPQCWVG